MGNTDTFQNIVFAGGGSRCLWQTGFMDAMPEGIKEKINNIACVSAGSLMACVAFAGVSRKALEHFKYISDKNRKNFYPENIFRSQAVFPHYLMYRDGILSIFEEANIALLQKKNINILMAAPPDGMHPVLAAITGLLLYSVEKRIKYPLHPEWSRKAGFSPVTGNVRQCRNISDLAELILRSSCMPPIMPYLKLNGKYMLDGGLIDNVPAWLLDNERGKKLILLSRRYNDRPDIFAIGDRVYVQPSSEVLIKRWDYTSPEGLQDAYDMGLMDGENFFSQYF